MFARMFGQKPAAVPLDQHQAIVAAFRDEIDTLRASCFAAERTVEGLTNDVQQAERAYEHQRSEAITNGRLAAELLTERDEARDVLRSIVSFATPGMASIGRKMAATAKAGLPEYATAEREAA